MWEKEGFWLVLREKETQRERDSQESRFAKINERKGTIDQLATNRAPAPQHIQKKSRNASRTGPIQRISHQGKEAIHMFADWLVLSFQTNSPRGMMRNRLLRFRGSCVAYISSAGWTVSEWFVLISLSVHEISLGFIRLLTLLTEKKETVEKVTLPHGLLRSWVYLLRV